MAASKMVFDFFIDFGRIEVIVAIGFGNERIAVGVKFIHKCRKSKNVGHLMNLNEAKSTPTKRIC